MPGVAMTEKSPFTVVLMLPDYLREGDARDWTQSHHVNASSVEDAFGEAQDAGIRGFYSPGDTDAPPPEDFAIIAVYAGHLQDLFIP
jgi:hypothetical protein